MTEKIQETDFIFQNLDIVPTGKRGSNTWEFKNFYLVHIGFWKCFFVILKFSLIHIYMLAYQNKSK